MKPPDDDDGRDPFPLGIPTNRKSPPPDLTPIPGRPHWYYDRQRHEIYQEREPVKKEPPSC